MATQSSEEEQDSTEESLPNSQFSQYSLELSQGTLNQILEVGGGTSNRSVLFLVCNQCNTHKDICWIIIYISIIIII